MGDERSALQAVVAADAELMELREEEEELNKQLQDASLEDKPKGFDADEASERLNEVYILLPQTVESVALHAGISMCGWHLVLYELISNNGAPYGFLSLMILHCLRLALSKAFCVSHLHIFQLQTLPLGTSVVL